MNARRDRPTGPAAPRSRKPQRSTGLPWLPYALGALAIVVVLAAIIYSAILGRLF